MIAPMKKVCIVLKEEDRRNVLKQLRQAGMVHIEPITDSLAASDDLSKELETFERALSTLSEYKKTKQESFNRTESLERARKIVELKDQENL